MKKHILLFLGLHLLMIGLSGCSGATRDAARIMNEDSVNEFLTLLTNNPEVGLATLKEINDVANGKVARLSLDNRRPLLSTLPQGDGKKESLVLLPGVASKAQTIISDVIDKYSFASFFDAGIMINAISLNQARANMEMMKSLEKEMTEFNGKNSFGGDKFSSNELDSKFSDNNGKEIPTCEEYLEHPAINASKKIMDMTVKNNQRMLKQAMTDCSSINGHKFIECTQSFNEATEMINTYANCGFDSINDLINNIDKNTNGRFSKLDRKNTECMTIQFKQCGFEIKNLDQSQIN